MNLVLIAVSYTDPIISPHLVSLGLPETYGGYCLGVLGGTHLLGAIAVGYLTSYPKPQIILFALITSSLSIFAIGPSQLMGYSASAKATFLGVGSNGFFTSFTEVLTIPIIIESIENEIESEGVTLTED